MTTLTAKRIRNEIKRLMIEGCDGCSGFNDDLVRDYGSSHQLGCNVSPIVAVNKYFYIALNALDINPFQIDTDDLQVLIITLWDSD